MGAGRTKKLITAAERLMQPGERIELTTMAKLGSAPVAETVVGGIAAGVLVGLLGGGVGFVGFSRQELYIVLTDRQLIFFSAVRSTGGVGKHLASFPRERITSSEARTTGLGLFVKTTIAVQGMNQPTKLTFPPLPPSARKQGRELAAALTSVRH